jgi:predicted  nucleic acid-binding Zn-ribbon protein
VIFLGPEGRRGTLITHGFHAPKELEVLKARGPVEEAHIETGALQLVQRNTLEGELLVAKQEIAALRADVQQMREVLARTTQQLEELKKSLGG